MKTKKIRELTRAEEEVMQVLWTIERGVVSQVLEHFPEPKPAYNTVSTIIRILEQKGFVGHKAYGRTYEYFPIVGKTEYSGAWFRNFVNNYFGNSIGSLGSFFARDAKLSLRELEELQRTLSEEICKQQKTQEP
jgi:predicted transcriptional regulator